MEIKFAIHRRWADAGEQAIARRVAQVISPPDDQFPVFEGEPHGNRWNLDGGNNWWLRIDLEGKTAKLHYRYGGGGNAEFMQSLEKVLTWVFN